MQNNLTELKSFGSPPPAVTNVVAAVMVLLAPGGKVPKDRSWKAAKSSIMAKVRDCVLQDHLGLSLWLHGFLAGPDLICRGSASVYLSH